MIRLPQLLLKQPPKAGSFENPYILTVNAIHNRAVTTVTEELIFGGKLE